MISIQLNVMLALLLLTNNEAKEHFWKRFRLWKGVDFEVEQNENNDQKNISIFEDTNVNSNTTEGQTNDVKIEVEAGSNQHLEEVANFSLDVVTPLQGSHLILVASTKI